MSPDDIPTVEVVASRHGRLWRLTYRDLCADCEKRRHYHGGGDGPEPFLGDGLWTTHCLTPTNPLVRLVLA
jgi:hypothetical protein